MTKNWTEKKAQILAYYRDEGMPLLKVMEIMKSKHSFHASQRAYRQQFQKWECFKYNRKSRNHHTLGHSTRHHHSRHIHHGMRSHQGHHDHQDHTSLDTKYQYQDFHRAMPYHDKDMHMQLPKMEPSSPYAMTHHGHYAPTNTRSTASPVSSPEAGDSYHERYVKTAYPESEHLQYKYQLPILPAPSQQYQPTQYYNMGSVAHDSTPGSHSPESIGQYQQPCCQQGRCSHSQSPVAHHAHPQSISLMHSNSSASSVSSTYSHQSPASSMSPASSHGSQSPPSHHISHSPEIHQSTQNHYGNTLPSLSYVACTA